MEDPTTGGDALFPPDFVTIHDLREQWLRRRPQRQERLETRPQRQERLETRPRSPHGKPPQQRTPPPPPSFPPLPAQKDRRKQPEQERPRRQADVGRERVKGGPRDECDSANCWAVRRNASVEEGSGGRRAIDSNGPKPSENSSRDECAGFGAEEKADSALAKDRRKQPEQELPRGETHTERERVKASPTNAADSRPSPANCSAVRRHTSSREGSDGGRAIDSNGPKPSEKSSRGECAGFGADEKADSALAKDRRKQPEQELPRGETHTERERVKASPTNSSDSRPSPANCSAVRRHTSGKEGSDVRRAIDSNGPKPTGKWSPGECAGFAADEKAESASVKDRRKQPEQELPQGETNNERERGKARPRNESDSRPSPSQCRAVPRNTSVKEGTGVREAIASDGPKSWQKSSRGRYGGIGTDEKAEWAPVAMVSADAESAEQVKKTKESKKKRKNNQKGKGKLNKDIVRAKEMGAKPEEGEMNTPAEEVKKEKFQRASSEGQNVMPESKELRVEAKPEEVVAHVTAKEAKKLFQPAGSESKDDMPESKEVVGVEVKNVAANASHVRAKAEGLNKQVWVINSKGEIEAKSRNLSLQYDSKRSGFPLGRPSRGDGKGYRGFVSKEKQRRVIKQSSDMVWVRKEDISDGHAGESSS